MKVELLSHWGDDLEVVNNARVSFDKMSEWDYVPCEDAVNGVCGACDEDSGMPHGCWCPRQVLKPADAHLIGYLARGCTSGQWDQILLDVSESIHREQLEAILKHVKRMPEHWAPFANGVGMKFRITAPIPIMRQVFKHKVGSVESEVSRRYVDDEPEFFYPEWRKRAENVKQGSSSEVFEPAPMEQWGRTYDPISGRSVEFMIPVDDQWFYQFCLDYYNHKLDQGCAPEQARFVLPQGTMTTAIISNSLYGWSRFFNQRSDRTHAQSEIADIADMVATEAEPLFPVSWKALTQ